MVRDCRDDEPCMISGETCAETLRRIGCPRQAAWCLGADRRRREMYEELDRVSKERDALLARLRKYEPAAVQVETGVRWTGD